MSLSDLGKIKKSDSDDALQVLGILFAVLIGVALVVGSVIAGTFINGFVLQNIWNNLFPKIFGDAVPVLTIWQAAGVALVVTYLNVRTTNLATRKDVGVKLTIWDHVLTLVMYVFISPLITILLGSFIAAQIAAGR